MKRKLSSVKQAEHELEESVQSDNKNKVEDSSSGGEEGMESEEEEAEESTTKGDKHKPSAGALEDGESRFKVAKLTKGELYKPPTNEEINRLRETENLFHSTLFRMEITELLAEVKLRDKRKAQINKAVETLKSSLLALKPGKKWQLEDRGWLKKSKIRLPLCDDQPDGAGYFHFLPPQEVRVTGSFMTDTCVKPNIHVDLLVVMPKESFSEKDYLNHRYSRKRSMYLCKIARGLRGREEVDSLKFLCHHGNHLKPVLVVGVKVEGHKQVEVRVHAVPDPDTFKLSRFHVNKNNVRCKWFYHEDADRQEQIDCPTPFINSTVLEDLTCAGVEAGMRQLQSHSEGVRDGLVLLKLWLRQRELDTGCGGFSGFIMTMFVLYLLYHKKISPYMSSYQVMRNTLLRLSQSDWTTSGITLCKDSSDMFMPTMSDFHRHAAVVFIDKSGYMNFCYAMNKSLYQRVVHEAGLSVTMLDDKSCDSFDLLFMRSLPFCLKFDHIFHIDLNRFSDKVVDVAHSSGKFVDHAGDKIGTFLPYMLDALQKGLGTRVTLMQVKQQATSVWDVKEEPTHLSQRSERITIGLLLNPDTASNVLDRGPSADTPQAVEFRQFWGDKSELRRFHGGGICEAILWTDKSQSVCEQVVRYVLHKHIGIQSDSITYLGQHLDPLLSLPVISFDGDTYGTGNKLNMDVIKVFEELGKLLHNIDDMPLTISSIQGVSPCFRFTEVFPPLPCTVHLISQKDNREDIKRFVPSAQKPCPWYTPALKVVCMLESSGKWPDDLDALQRLKAAFYTQLSGALTAKHKLPVRTTPTYIDILKDHYVFRVELACAKEISLLKTVKTPEGMVKKRDTEAALGLEKRIIALPKLTSVLYGLHKQQLAFSPSVRLAKRWVCAHMLGDYVHPIAIELIVAHLFLNPAPHTPPRSGSVGFLRFLSFLSKFDWKTTALMVDLNGEYTDEDKTEIPTRFSKERDSLPLMFISTPMDKYSSHWTRYSPTPAILQRLVLLAQSSLTVLQQQMMGDGEPDYKHAFRPSLSVFDVVIHLKQQQVPRQFECLDVTDDTYRPKYGRSVEEDRFPVIEYQPVQLLLKELRETLDELCLFFYNPHGSLVIGMLWKPNALQTHGFKISHINHRRPQADTGADAEEIQLEPNVEAILEDISVIGRGLVQSIDVKDK